MEYLVWSPLLLLYPPLDFVFEDSVSEEGLNVCLHHVHYILQNAILFESLLNDPSLHMVTEHPSLEFYANLSHCVGHIH
jgi:hypothetical protein